MRRLWIGILVACLVAAGCIGLDDSDAMDPAAEGEDDANTTETGADEPEASETNVSAPDAGEANETSNRSVFDLEQEATLEFTHVATPAHRSHRGENCLNYPDEPPVETLWGAANVTWTPTTPLYETLQVRLASGVEVLAEAQGTSPLTLAVDEVAPAGDDLMVFVDTPRDPVGLAIQQEASLSVDFTYEGTEQVRFEDGWGCTFATGG